MLEKESKIKDEKIFSKAADLSLEDVVYFF
jgi:hypothetical protein